MRQVQVVASTFTYKDIKYNKGAVIEVDELEEARLLGSYPFALKKPAITTANEIRKPAPTPVPTSSPINTSDLRVGGKKNDTPAPPTAPPVAPPTPPKPAVKSDKELLEEMKFPELKKLGKSLGLKIRIGLSKVKLIDLILKTK